MQSRDLFYYTQEEKNIWDEISAPLCDVGGLNKTGIDKYGNPIPAHLGPHSIYAIKLTANAIKPKRILEIGFNMGRSASMWLKFTDANITSVDISDKEETMHGASYLKQQYGERFEFVLADSTKVYDLLKDKKFDLIFIDGDHTLDYVKSDIELGLKLNIPWFCFDDILPQYGDVMDAIKQYPLDMVEIFGNIGYAKIRQEE